MEDQMNEHYFAKKPKSKAELGLIKARLRGREFRFLTASGIFSYKKIDRGTELLASNMVIKQGDYVLDLGCGYGVLGIAAAKIAGRAILTEVNSRAANLARKNLKLNNIANAEVREGNLYEPVANENFNVTLCNLPMSAGLGVVYEIIEKSRARLKSGGTLQVVVRKGAKRIEQKMREIFGNVATLAKKGGYRVFLSTLEY